MNCQFINSFGISPTSSCKITKDTIIYSDGDLILHRDFQARIPKSINSNDILDFRLIEHKLKVGPIKYCRSSNDLVAIVTVDNRLVIFSPQLQKIGQDFSYKRQIDSICICRRAIIIGGDCFMQILDLAEILKDPQYRGTRGQLDAYSNSQIIGIACDFELEHVFAITKNSILLYLSPNLRLEKWLDAKIINPCGIAVNDKFVAIAGAVGLIRFFSVDTLKYLGNCITFDNPTYPLTIEKNSSNSMVGLPNLRNIYSVDSSKLACIGNDRSLTVIDTTDLKNQKQLLYIGGHGEILYNITVGIYINQKYCVIENKKLSELYMTASRDGLIKLWKLSQEHELVLFATYFFGISTAYKPTNLDILTFEIDERTQKGLFSNINSSIYIVDFERQTVLLDFQSKIQSIVQLKVLNEGQISLLFVFGQTGVEIWNIQDISKPIFLEEVTIFNSLASCVAVEGNLYLAYLENESVLKVTIYDSISKKFNIIKSVACKSRPMSIFISKNTALLSVLSSNDQIMTFDLHNLENQPTIINLAEPTGIELTRKDWVELISNKTCKYFLCLDLAGNVYIVDQNGIVNQLNPKNVKTMQLLYLSTGPPLLATFSTFGTTILWSLPDIFKEPSPIISTGTKLSPVTNGLIELSEDDLPSWARKQKENNKNPNRTLKLHGKWAERSPAASVRLYSDNSINEDIVAKAELYPRRLSVELGNESKQILTIPIAEPEISPSSLTVHSINSPKRNDRISDQLESDLETSPSTSHFNTPQTNLPSKYFIADNDLLHFERLAIQTCDAITHLSSQESLAARKTLARVNAKITSTMVQSDWTHELLEKYSDKLVAMVEAKLNNQKNK